MVLTLGGALLSPSQPCCFLTLAESQLSPSNKPCVGKDMNIVSKDTS